MRLYQYALKKEKKINANNCFNYIIFVLLNIKQPRVLDLKYENDK